jgi:hypothetical protein
MILSRLAAIPLLAALITAGLQATTVEPPVSPLYRVEVTHAGVTQPVVTYFSPAQKRDSNLSKDASWASFDFTGRVTVRVFNLAGDFTRSRLLPSSRGIAVHINGRTVSFDLVRPGQFAIEFDEGIAHPLFIFANAPEQDVPNERDPGVVFFGPGVHDLGETMIAPKAGQTVYLAPGSFVFGRIRVSDAPGVTVRGRGILSGGHLPPNPPGTYTVPHLIEFDAASHHGTVEGITLIESPHYNLLFKGTDCVARNLKTIGWWFGTDGIGFGDRGLVEDCFLRCNDDALKLYSSGMIARRCVIWQMENGAPFQFSWNMNTDNSGFLVSDCDVIHVDHHKEAENRAIFNAVHGGSGHLSDYLFENIRIENAHYRFLLLQIKKTSWAKAKEWGRLSNIQLRNVTADGPFSKRSAIRSDDPAGRIDGVTFTDVQIGGRLLLDADDAQLDVDPATTSDISFYAK